MEKEDKRSLLENIVFYMGIVILAGLLGYLIFQIFSDDDSPADIIIDIKPQPQPDCVFEIQFENNGGTTAEQILVGLDLYASGEKVDHTIARIDYLPIQSTQTVRVRFENLQGCDSLRVASLTFVEP